LELELARVSNIPSGAALSSSWMEVGNLRTRLLRTWSMVLEPAVQSGNVYLAAMPDCCLPSPITYPPHFDLPPRHPPNQPYIYNLAQWWELGEVERCWNMVVGREWHWKAFEILRTLRVIFELRIGRSWHFLHCSHTDKADSALAEVYSLHLPRS